MLKGPTSTRLALLSDFFLVFLHRPLASCASQGASHSKASQPHIPKPGGCPLPCPSDGARERPRQVWGWFVGGFFPGRICHDRGTHGVGTMGKRWGQRGYLVFSESLHLLDENKPIQGNPNQSILAKPRGLRGVAGVRPLQPPPLSLRGCFGPWFYLAARSRLLKRKPCPWPCVS